MTVMAKALPCFAVISAVWGQAPATGQPESGWEERVNEEGRKVQSLQISAPSMTEEDQYGYVMPDRYRCDSCKVVVHHLSEALSKKQPKSRQLRESELEDIFEDTCKSAFKGYGITLVNGENALSGPALQRSGVEPGSGSIQMGGETWEKRLGEICRKMVYDKVGEEEIYRHFRAAGKLSEELCVSHSRDCQASGKAEMKQKKASGKAEMKQKKEKKPSKKISEKTWEKREGQVSVGEMSSGEAGFASDDEVRAILQARAEGDVPPEDSQKSKRQASKKSDEDNASQKREQSRQAREQKLKRDIEATQEKQDHLDAETFFKKLAVEHGLPVEEYTRKRTAKEWEQVLMRAAGRIYESRDMEPTVQV